MEGDLKMKAKITVGFSAKLQVVSFNPVESNDSLELEIEYKDEKDLEKKIEHYQELIRGKCIQNTIRGGEEYVAARTKSLLLEKE